MFIDEKPVFDLYPVESVYPPPPPDGPFDVPRLYLPPLGYLLPGTYRGGLSSPVGLLADGPSPGFNGGFELLGSLLMFYPAPDGQLI